MAFDLLRLEGRSTLALPYTERRSLLEGLELDGPHWRTPPHWTEDGASILKAAREQQLEGVVAKQPTRLLPRPPVQRLAQGQEPAHPGGRDRRLAARRGPARGLDRLAAARAARGRRLRYVGKVGTGFTDRSLRELAELLEPLRADIAVPRAGASPRRRRCDLGQARRSWARCGSASGPATAGCGTRPGAGCGRTRRCRRSSGRVSGLAAPASRGQALA